MQIIKEQMAAPKKLSAGKKLLMHAFKLHSPELPAAWQAPATVTTHASLVYGP